MKTRRKDPRRYNEDGSLTPTAITFMNMHRRCYYPKSGSYIRYGAKGIRVCPEWFDWNIFYNDMGERPTDMTLDRIKSSEGYSKENCKWSNLKEQNDNRSHVHWVILDNKLMTFSDACRQLEVVKNTLISRMIRKNLTAQEAIDQQVYKDSVV